MDYFAATVRVGLRLVTGDRIGAVGKLHALTSAAPDTSTRDGDYTYTGTVGQVIHDPDTGTAYKYVDSHAVDTVKTEAAALRTVAHMLSWIRPGIANGLCNTADDLEREIDMVNERACARKLSVAVRRLPEHLALHIKPEVPSECTATTFAYEFTEGVTLGSVVPSDRRFQAARTVAEGFFRLLHSEGILLLDPSERNFVIGPDTGGADGSACLVWIIDAGSTHQLTLEERKAALRLHRARTSASALRAALGGDSVPLAVVSILRSFVAPFWDDTKELPPLERALGLLTSPSALAGDVHAHVVRLVRSVLTLVVMLRRCDCARPCIAGAMAELALSPKCT